MDYTELSVELTTGSKIIVKLELHTVPSRLIGETRRIHHYHNKFVGFVGQTQAIKLNRVYLDKSKGRARRIDYCYVIHALAAMHIPPQAFRFPK